MDNSYYYLEMGTRNKKSGKLPFYRVKVSDQKILDCECQARQFRRHTPCKHMINLQSKNSILFI